MARQDIDIDDLFVHINALPAVQAKVKERAARIAARSRKELSRAGIDADVEVRAHPLATGRASFDVYAEAPDGKERRVGKILRRAGREGRSR